MVPEFGWDTAGHTANCLSVFTVPPPRGAILTGSGIDPAPQAGGRPPGRRSCAASADAILACDFLETVTLGGNANTSWPS